MKLHIHHRTVYRYATKVSFGPHQLLLRPRESHALKLDSFTLKIRSAHRLRWMRDVYENNMGLIEFGEPAQELEIETESEVTVYEENPFDFIIDRSALEYPFAYHPDVHSELAALLPPIYVRDTAAIAAWLTPLWHPGRRRPTFEVLQELNTKIYRDIRYQRREHKGVQSPAETLEKRSGSCRDLATLFLETCRFLGLAARFVSGYMQHEEITGRMSMHGWAEVYLPGAGWIGFDPSWGILAAAPYIPVAVVRHPEHAPPISGTFFGYARDYLRTDVDLYVRPIDPEPVRKAPKDLPKEQPLERSKEAPVAVPPARQSQSQNGP